MSSYSRVCSSDDKEKEKIRTITWRTADGDKCDLYLEVVEDGDALLLGPQREVTLIGGVVRLGAVHQLRIEPIINRHPAKRE